MWQIQGYPKVVALLEHSHSSGTLAHAYLFVGPPHVGKMTLALSLAQALNCEAAEPPCGECTPCRRVASAKHADVRVITLTSDANSTDSKPRTEIGIDSIRDLQHTASLPPFEGKHKVFIIDDAEHMSSEAANCLLKTLEEPPPCVSLFLLIERENLLLSTVASRCQRLELRPLSTASVEAILNQQPQVDAERIHLIARLSGGCLGWALTAMVDEDVLCRRTERLGTHTALATEGHEKRFAYAATLAAQPDKKRKGIEEEINLWLSWWRDLILIKAGCGTNITNIDQEVVLHRWGDKLSLGQIKNFIDSLRACQEQLAYNANPRLALEVLMLRMPQLQ